jgi:uncharacterized protein YndB with AHSA1/START domain
MATELHIERVFDASRELVWKSFTDPDQIAKWFDPSATRSPPRPSRSTSAWELHDENGKTRLVIHQGPYRDDFVGNARDGWMSSFTKLAALLAA